MTATVNHTERAHATYSPSAAKRWMMCSTSVRLGRDRPSSSFSQQGTAAHQLGERCLVDESRPEDYLGKFIDLTPGRNDPFRDEAEPDDFFVWEVDYEMVDGIDMYLGVIDEILARHPDAEMWIEQRVDLRYLGHDIWGTGDVVIYVPSIKKVYVIDLKYGQGVAVDARQNPQLLVYGTGAAKALEHRGVDLIELVIVQPRAYHREGPIRRYETDWTEIALFEQEIVDAIVNDRGTVPGDHCVFCSRMGECQEYRDWSGESVGLDLSKVEEETIVPPHVADMDLDRLGMTYANAIRLERWIKAVKELAKECAFAGRVPTGTKIVDGRVYRVYRDKKVAAEKMSKSGLHDDDIYEKKLISVSKLEKLIGKKRVKALLGDEIKHTTPVRTLVSLDDEREDVTPGSHFDVVTED